jgi:manganese efflux pump family protein
MPEDATYVALTMVGLLVVAIALGLNNFGAAIAIGVSGVNRRTELKVATVFGLCDVVMPAIGMLIGTGLAGPLGSAARWVGAGILCATAIWGLIEALRGDDDTPKIWHGWRLLVSGAALSLDDLAVGLALGTVRYPIVLAVTLFGLLSFIMSIIGLQLGGKLGKATGEHGEVVGAIMLLGLSGVMAAGWLLPRREREVTACHRAGIGASSAVDHGAVPAHDGDALTRHPERGILGVRTADTRIRSEPRQLPQLARARGAQADLHDVGQDIRHLRCLGRCRTSGRHPHRALPERQARQLLRHGRNDRARRIRAVPHC